MELRLLIKDYDGLMHAIVNMRKLDDEGKYVGNMNNKPLLNNRAYEIQFDYGTTEVITTTNIAKNILAQVDEEGHCQILIDDIIYHR